MKKVLYIIFLVIPSLSHGQGNDIIGQWACDGMIAIDTVFSIDPDGYKIDTFYYALPVIVELKKNNIVITYTNEKLKGSWKIDNEVLSFEIDSLSFTGRIEDNKLLFINPFGPDENLYFSKIEPKLTRKLSVRKLLGSYLTYTLDSMNYSIHFLDKRLAVISNGYITIRSNWTTDFCEGSQRIILNDYYMDDHYFILTEYVSKAYSGITFREHWWNQKFPKKQIVMLKEEEYLTKKEMAEKVKMLTNTWSSESEFYPNDTSLFEAELLTDISFNFQLGESKYYYEYKGIGTVSGKEYKISQEGPWTISETGEYLILSHYEEYDSRTIEMKEFVTLVDIGSNKLTIVKEIDCLSDESCFYGFNEIELVKE